MRNLSRIRGAIPQFSVLEVGTGRFPIVPLYMYLRGAMHTASLDIATLLREDTIWATIKMYAEHIASGYVPEAQPDRAAELWMLGNARSRCTGKEALRHLNIEIAVGNCQNAVRGARSFDLLISNTVFEHIPTKALLALLRDFRGLARADAVMSHFVDMEDHYAQFDPSIGVFNYLRYSEKQWRRYNNSLQYQNRLRVEDYRSLHKSAGWQILFEDNRCGAEEELGSVPLAEEFQHYSQQDLLVCDSWIVSQSAIEASDKSESMRSPERGAEATLDAKNEWPYVAHRHGSAPL